jgi:hypothetical protein
LFIFRNIRITNPQRRNFVREVAAAHSCERASTERVAYASISARVI